MKVYSIGREVNCDIVINDQTDIISRRHAILSVFPFGKMTITDQSHNGTYVNGIRISSNVPVPVTRKDNISFAHIARLDWNLIPDTRKKILWYVLGGIAALALIVGLIWGISKFVKHGDQPASAPTPTQTSTVADSIPAKQTEEQLQKEEERKQDSIKKQVRDSIDKERAKRVPPKPAPTPSAPRKDVGKKEANSGSSNPPKKQEPKKEDGGSTTRFH